MKAFSVCDAAEYREIRGVFERAAYNEETLIQTFGPVRLPRRAGIDLHHLLSLANRDCPADTLARLFLLAVDADCESTERALAPTPLETFIRTGLLERTMDRVVATVRIVPFRGLLLASDHPDRAGSAESPDQVSGITEATTTLANFTARHGVGRTLDLGTGTGVQAFLAAPHSREVYGVDISERAVEFAQFNAALNGIPNVRFLHGDGFEAVDGIGFDLIVSNPPFMISPGRRYVYRDSGEAGDVFCRNLVRQAPARLVEGGFFQMVCDWIQPAGDDWGERLSGWFEGTGCDAWVMRIEEREASGYANDWIRDTEYGSDEDLSRLYDEWMEYYRRAAIETVGTGLIAMRRRTSGSNWVRIEEAPERISGPFGDSVLRGFELRDYLTAVSDEELLGVKLLASRDLRLDQTSEWTERGWRVTSAEVRLGRGLQYTGNVDHRVAALIARCDGSRTLGELIGQLAQAAGVSADAIASSCVGLMRELIGRGFLLPPGTP